MTAVVVVFAFIVAFSAIVCGHQGEDLPRFAVRAVLRRTIRPTNRPRSNR
ncbi:hypothetical protein [Streptomyces caniscabiei]|nr:hypothetical protein [Streptomyces caniscabiei]MBE4783940.1 hypothetical protein [Streptomyces caniscabiei]MBE4791561.1 hypothetical protein [Streptomyces caniscabiei]MDX3009202.1 hypothetical protein [Streptomyces caniscabiei]